MVSWGEPYGGIAYKEHPCFLVNGPLEYLHMRVLRNLLRIVSGWPGKELKEKRLFIEGKYHQIYNTCVSIFGFVLQAWYLIEYSTKLSFFELGHMYVALLMNVLSTSRGFTLCLSQRYKNLAAMFLTQFHLFYHKEKSDYSRKIYAKVHLVTNWFSAIQVGLMVCAVLLFNLVPILMNYSTGKFVKFEDPVNATLELAIYFKLPKDPEISIKVYCYSCIFNFFISYLCASSIIMFDLLLSIIVFNIWGHFKILLHTLETIPKPAVGAANDGALKGLSLMYSPEENVATSAKLKECIVYHRFIIDFINEMSSVFGIVLFVYYMFHQVSGCLLLLECSQGSEKLKDEVYCLPWEYMNTKNRRTVLMFLINVQEPVHIKAGGLVNVGVSTMSAILRGSFSYFAFLRTMSD